MQTRHHILTLCSVLYSLDWTPCYIRELVGYLVDNPKAFVFRFQYTHLQEGDHWGWGVAFQKVEQ
jgi:hypothetical protein